MQAFFVHTTPPCPGRLWRIETDPGGTGLAAEVRDPESKSLDFYYIDFALSQPAWRKTATPASWWHGLLGLRQDLLLYHGYEGPDWPVKKGVFAVDVVSAAPAWEQPELRPRRLEGNAILCQGEKPGQDFWVDCRSGEPTLSPDYSIAVRHRTPVAANAPQIHFWVRRFGKSTHLQVLIFNEVAAMAALTEQGPHIAFFHHEDTLFDAALDPELCKPGSPFFYEENGKFIWIEPGMKISWAIVQGRST